MDQVGATLGTNSVRCDDLSKRKDLKVVPRIMSALSGVFNRSLQHRSQSIGRSFKPQGLARTLVETQSDLVQVGLRELREIYPLREILSKQPIGVLVAAALPGTAWITEINLHVGGNREALVIRHLLAAIPRSMSDATQKAACARV